MLVAATCGLAAFTIRRRSPLRLSSEPAVKACHSEFAGRYVTGTAGDAPRAVALRRDGPAHFCVAADRDAKNEVASYRSTTFSPSS